MTPDQTIAALLERIDALEARVNALEGKTTARPRAERPEPSDAKLAHVEAIRPVVANAMSGRAGRYTASEVAELAGLHPDNGTLRSIGLLCRQWRLAHWKSGGRRPYQFTGTELR